MKQPIIKIDFTYNSKGEGLNISITRGSFYITHTTRTYTYNSMSDAQHNLNIALSNRDKWTTSFFKNKITSYPAHFMLMEEDKCRAAGSLDHCKHFHKPGYKIIRRTNYPTLKG